jgi:uncharacterized protein YfaS (alpha-2-macroglobulin family)
VKRIFLICLVFVPAILLLLLLVLGPALSGPSSSQAYQSSYPEVLTATLEIDPDLSISPVAPLSVRFNQPVNSTSAQPAFLTFPYVSGDIQWNDNFTQLTFIPETMLASNTTYLFFMDADLQGVDGARFEQPPSWEARTSTLPKITNNTPQDLNTNANEQDIEVTFSRVMDGDSLLSAIHVEPEFPYELSFSIGNKLVIHLSTVPKPETTYRITIDGKATDINNVPLVEDARLEYHTPSFLNEYKLSESNKSILIDFNYIIDTDKTGIPTTISPQTPGEWRWFDADTLVFDAQELLSFGVNYQVSFIAPILDLDGNPYPQLPDFSVHRKPPITKVIPEPDDYWDRCGQISMLFMVKMDKTKTEAAFHLTPEVPGAFTWVGNEMRFIPASPVADGSYTAELNTEASTVDGKPILFEPYKWSFSCYSYDYNAPLSWGYGEKIQVVDADGRRSLQFSKNIKGETQVTFSLYSFSKEAFIDRYLSDDWFADLPDVAVKTWSITTTGETYQEMFIPEDVQPGLYILKLMGAETEDSLFLVLTHNTLMVKEGLNEVTVWASDINDNPSPSLKVEVYADGGEKISQGRTDDNGLFTGNINPVYSPYLVLAYTPDGDYTLSGMSYAWRSSYCYVQGCWGSYDRYKIYTYTDRPIYKPGQTVFFKSILRMDEDAQYRLLDENTSITVNLLDPRSNLLQTQTLRTNSFGTINSQFIIPEGGGLGLYKLEVLVDGESQTQAFKVQDYRKPDIQVTVASDSDQYVQGETVKVRVDANYFFGQPVAGAHISVTLYELWPDWDWWWDGDETDSKINEKFNWSSDGKKLPFGITDANGVFTNTFKAQIGEYTSYSWWKDSLEKNLWAIEVTVDDGSNQQTSSSKIIQVYNSDIKISLDRGSFFKEAGKSFIVEGKVTNLQNEPVANQELSLTLLGSSDYWEFNRTITTTDITSDQEGLIQVPWKIDFPGYYKIQISTKDKNNHKLEYETWISVTAKEIGWQDWMSEELKIYSEFDHYKTSQTARFMIESTFSGPALLTLERGKVLRTIPIQLTEPLTEVKIPLTTSDSPNVFVTVSAWQSIDNSLETLIAQQYYDWALESAPDSRLRSDSVEIQVDASFRNLTVEIIPDKSNYAPRQEAKFTIKVSDSDGNPVNAEISLALVDEAIFSLSNELSGPIFDAFYQRRNLSVVSYDSMQPNRYLLNTGGERGGGGGDGGVGEAPRYDFPDTALWVPVERTGDDGVVNVVVTLPDNLTTWRATVKAVTRSTRVGEATANITTRKDVSLRPILPRSLTVSDHLDLTTWVHNFSPVTRTITVSLTANLLMIEDSPTLTITLKPEEAKEISWSVSALAEGEAKILIRANDSSGEGDAIQLPLTIHPLAASVFDYQVGTFQSMMTTTLVLPEGALPSSEYEVMLHRTLAGNLFQGLEYLTGYPYGCVEQTMSRVLPNAVVARVMDRLGWSSATLETELPKLISTGISKLYGLQHQDGGWGWWYDDLTNDYQTAWVIYGLAVTADAGYFVEPEVMKNGANWLVENLSSMDIRTRAYALYSLAIAGYGDKDATISLTEEFYDLDPFSQAALVLALDILGEKEQAQNLLGILVDQAVVDEDQVYWINSKHDGEYYNKTMTSNLRSTALVLDAILKLRPNDKLIPGIVRYLMNQRHGYGWGNTNETSFTILALTNYILTERGTGNGSKVEISINDQVIYQGTVEVTDQGIHVVIPTQQLQTGLNNLKISSADDHHLYYELINTAWLPAPSIKPAGEIQVKRIYYDPDTSNPIQSFKAGQLVEVRLHINFPEEAAFIMVEDYLPGGFEALNENLNNTAFNPIFDEYGEDYNLNWQKYGYNNKQIFGDRVSFFINEILKKSYTFRYLVRATQSGTFYAMPAEVSAMYDETLYGRSDSVVLIVNR